MDGKTFLSIFLLWAVGGFFIFAIIRVKNYLWQKQCGIIEDLLTNTALLKRREKLGLTREDVAELAGISIEQYMSFEVNCGIDDDDFIDLVIDLAPRIAMVLKSAVDELFDVKGIAEYFGINADELLDYWKQMSKREEDNVVENS